MWQCHDKSAFFLTFWQNENAGDGSFCNENTIPEAEFVCWGPQIGLQVVFQVSDCFLFLTEYFPLYYNPHVINSDEVLRVTLMSYIHSKTLTLLQIITNVGVQVPNSFSWQNPWEEADLITSITFSCFSNTRALLVRNMFYVNNQNWSHVPFVFSSIFCFLHILFIPLFMRVFTF